VANQAILLNIGSEQLLVVAWARTQLEPPNTKHKISPNDTKWLLVVPARRVEIWCMHAFSFAGILKRLPLF
jgi:hypothetical protein